MNSRKTSPKIVPPASAPETGLRKRAKAIVSEKESRTGENPENLSPEALLQALHELRVNQIELEMQNEELQSTQAALEAANERYFSFYNLAPVGFCTLNDKGQIMEANLTFAAWVGVERGALVNTPLSLFIFPEDQDIYFLQKKQLFKTHGTQTFELRMLRPDGMTFWTILEASIFHLPDGAPICRIVLSDITGRKRTEQALRESEKNLASLFDAITESVYLIDAEGLLLSVNQTAAQRFGLSPEDMKGKSTYTFLPEQIAKPRREKIEEVFRTGREVRFEDYRSGSYFKHALYPIYNEDGKVVRLGGFSQNVTDIKKVESALQESEKNLATMFDAITESLYLIDTEGLLLSVNKTTAQWFDLLPEDIQGRAAYQFFPKDIAKSRREKIEEVFRTGQEVRFEDNHKGKHFKHELYPVFGADGKVSRLAGVSHDITDLKKKESELKASHAQLRELTQHLQTAREQERIRIARGIHDELGQVLTAITLESSWLAKKLTKRQQALKASAEATASLATNAILSVKRIISELRPSLLNDLGLGEAIKWQAGEYQKRSGIQFAISVNLEDKLFPDDISTAVFRIFQESITNAIRHAKATKISVSLKEKSGDIELIVKDNGIGIDRDKQKEDAFGIIGMKERATVLKGHFEIVGSRGKGTSVVARIPVKTD